MLIRRQETTSREIAPFAPADWPPRRPAQAAPEDTGEAELRELREQVKSLREALADAEAKGETAADAAFERGKEQGRRAADARAAERLDLLRNALAEATEACLARLHEHGDLAIEIARAAIRTVLGESTPRAELVPEIARRALAGVASGARIKVRVSGDDFPSDEELLALGGALGQVEVSRDDALPGGSCLIDLALGTIDASLGVQLEELDGELARFADGAKAST